MILKMNFETGFVKMVRYQLALLHLSARHSTPLARLAPHCSTPVRMSAALRFLLPLMSVLRTNFPLVMNSLFQTNSLPQRNFPLPMNSLPPTNFLLPMSFLPRRNSLLVLPNPDPNLDQNSTPDQNLLDHTVPSESSFAVCLTA